MSYTLNEAGGGGGGGEGGYSAKYREALPLGPTPYPLYAIMTEIWRYTFHVTAIKKGTPLPYLRVNIASLFLNL